MRRLRSPPTPPSPLYLPSASPRTSVPHPSSHDRKQCRRLPHLAQGDSSLTHPHASIHPVEHRPTSPSHGLMFSPVACRTPSITQSDFIASAQHTQIPRPATLPLRMKTRSGRRDGEDDRWMVDVWGRGHAGSSGQSRVIESPRAEYRMMPWRCPAATASCIWDLVAAAVGCALVQAINQRQQRLVDHVDAMA